MTTDIATLRQKAGILADLQKAQRDLERAEAEAAQQARRQQAEELLANLDAEFSASLAAYRQVVAAEAAELAELVTQFNRVVARRRQRQTQADKLYQVASRRAAQALYLTPSLSPLYRPGDKITGEEIQSQAQQSLLEQNAWPLMAVKPAEPNAGLILAAVEQAAR